MSQGTEKSSHVKLLGKSHRADNQGSLQLHEACRAGPARQCFSSSGKGARAVLLSADYRPSICTRPRCQCGQKEGSRAALTRLSLQGPVQGLLLPAGGASSPALHRHQLSPCPPLHASSFTDLGNTSSCPPNLPLKQKLLLSGKKAKNIYANNVRCREVGNTA